jgi:hypothetical protein
VNKINAAVMERYVDRASSFMYFVRPFLCLTVIHTCHRTNLKTNLETKDEEL